MFESIAYAMGPTGGGGATDPMGIFGQLMPLILIIAVFYFVLIRPQQKKAKQQQEMLKSLKKGDAVITNGGFFGRIDGFKDDNVVLDLGNDVKVVVVRAALSVLPAGQSSPVPVAKKSKKKDAAESSTDAENNTEE